MKRLEAVNKENSEFSHSSSINANIDSVSLYSPFDKILQQGLISSIAVGSLPLTAFAAANEQLFSSSYSNLSLYFTLALYVLTLPGLYSLVTRSVKVKNTQVAYDLPGPANPTAKPLRQTAAEIMAYFKALNYEISTAEDVITFRGVMGKSKSQAAFLTFCTFMGLGSMGLVLSILLPDLGAKAYALTLLSPYAGIYYWNNASREDIVQVKMETSDDEQITSVIARGGKEDLERFSKTLNLPERGKVYVKGLFEPVATNPLGTVVMVDNANGEAFVTSITPTTTTQSTASSTATTTATTTNDVQS